ncbi:hypothetical protein C5T95_30300, partial [Raoultella ornithinolytica]|uniref:hypothetical protein n=1 Tax=Raoultella ornithinolytica TaxID=54291 RepID=UPI000D45205A
HKLPKGKILVTHNGLKASNMKKILIEAGRELGMDENELNPDFRGLTLSGTKTHVKQRFLPLTPLLMVSDVLWSPVLPA